MRESAYDDEITQSNEIVSIVFGGGGGDETIGMIRDDISIYIAILHTTSTSIVSWTMDTIIFRCGICAALLKTKIIECVMDEVK